MTAGDHTELHVRSHISEGVARLTLDRPAALNAITPTMLDQLVAALESVAADGSVSVLVLEGAGRAFCAGVDLKSLGDRALTGGSVGDVLDLPARRVMSLLGEIDAITMAKVHGYCFTGALELALACDFIVVAAGAELGDTHARWGLRPTWGMSQRLASAVGVRRARYLSSTARSFSGTDAAEWGLAVEAVPDEELDARVAEICGEITSNSRGSLAAYKALYRAAERRLLDDGLSYEATTSFEIDDTADRLQRFR